MAPGNAGEIEVKSKPKPRIPRVVPEPRDQHRPLHCQRRDDEVERDCRVAVPVVRVGVGDERARGRESARRGDGDGDGDGGAQTVRKGER